MDEILPMDPIIYAIEQLLSFKNGLRLTDVDIQQDKPKEKENKCLHITKPAWKSSQF